MGFFSSCETQLSLSVVFERARPLYVSGFIGDADQYVASAAPGLCISSPREVFSPD